MLEPNVDNFRKSECCFPVLVCHTFGVQPFARAVFACDFMVFVCPSFCSAFCLKSISGVFLAHINNCGVLMNAWFDCRGLLHLEWK